MTEPNRTQGAVAQDLALVYPSVGVRMEDGDVACITAYDDAGREHYVLRVAPGGTVLGRRYPQRGRRASYTGLERRS